MRCGASDEKHGRGHGTKEPGLRWAGAAHRVPRELLGGACPPSGSPGPHVAPRAAPARMSRSGPSNDPVRSDNALDGDPEERRLFRIVGRLGAGAAVGLAA